MITVIYITYISYWQLCMFIKYDAATYSRGQYFLFALYECYWQQCYSSTIIFQIFLFRSYALFVNQSEYCLYFKYIISIINSDNNLKNTFWEIRSNKNSEILKFQYFSFFYFSGISLHCEMKLIQIAFTSVDNIRFIINLITMPRNAWKVEKRKILTF